MVEGGLAQMLGRVMKFGLAGAAAPAPPGDRVGEGRGRVVGGGVLGRAEGHLRRVKFLDRVTSWRKGRKTRGKGLRLV